MLPSMWPFCDTCQRVKTEHQRPARMLQLLQVPEYKRKETTNDFVMGLPRIQSRERFPLGNCGPTDQGSSLQACQDNLYRTATSRVVYA
jgi:hypothetical protein